MDPEPEQEKPDADDELPESFKEGRLKGAMLPPPKVPLEEAEAHIALLMLQVEEMSRLSGRHPLVGVPITNPSLRDWFHH